jgi:hypothetical protein
MKKYGGVDVEINVFLTSALVRGELPASRPCSFNPGERASGTHCIGCWIDPHRDSNSDPSVVQPAAIRYTDSATAVLQFLERMDIDARKIKEFAFEKCVA